MLSQIHMHTCKYVRSANTVSLTHSLPLPPLRPLSQQHTQHERTPKRQSIYICTHTHTHSHSHTLTHARTHARTHSLAHHESTPECQRSPAHLIQTGRDSTHARKRHRHARHARQLLAPTRQRRSQRQGIQRLPLLRHQPPPPCTPRPRT